jgi:hypothetical protein
MRNRCADETAAGNHERTLLTALIRGQREIDAGQGHELDEVMAAADVELSIEDS